MEVLTGQSRDAFASPGAPASIPATAFPSATEGSPASAGAVTASATAAGQEPLVGKTSLAMVVMVLALVVALGYWATRQHEVDSVHATVERAHALADALGGGAEFMLEAGDLTALRRVLAETAHSQNLHELDLVLPDGRVVAASTSARITALDLPSKWTAGPAPQFPSTASVATFSKPITVAEHGVAYLRVAAKVSDTTDRFILNLAFIAIVGAVGISGLLHVDRRTRQRLKAVTAVRSALLSVQASGSSASALDPALGPEAVAWNAFIVDREANRRNALTERALEAVGRKRQGRSDLDAACDAMSHGLLLMDDQGAVRYANGAASAFLAVDREKLIGSELGSVLQVEGVVSAVKAIVSGTSRKRSVIDVERKNEPGNPADAGKTPRNDGKAAGGVLRFNVRPVRRDDAASAMVVIEDITQQKAAEEARHAFVAQATHELRTPLTNIRLYVESAIEDGEQDPSIRVQALNVINSESRRLERVVSEMLSVAEIEAGAFKLKTDDVRIETLLDELKNDYQQQAAEKKLSVTFLLPPKMPVLYGDRDKVAVALHNLVGNALKYTPSGGSITVQVAADDKQLAVAVADTGIGISEEDCQKVFDRFYRANDGRVEKITGTGLGLTIAREVARLHGGDIALESQLNKGSTFTLTLPLRAAA